MMVSNLFDVAVLAWVIVGALAGFWAGFFRSVARIAGYFVAFWAAGLYYRQLAALLDDRVNAARWLSGFLSRQLPLPVEVANLPVGAVPLERLAAGKGFVLAPAQGEWLFGKLRQGLEQAASAGADTFAAALYAALGHLAVEALAFLMLFAVFQLLADAGGKLLQMTVGRVPLFWGMNRVGGAALGAVQHVLFAALTVAILSPFLGFLSPQPAVLAMQQSSFGPRLLALGQLLFRLALL